ncbi:MAG: TfoX/Sxy family protein [Candidatus Dormibacteraeota bacterium]|nr:TfoX/Sxy family protein [Candidatus Dormibacteraeota bacterium]
MAFDEALADRLRERLAAQRGVTEKKMFGGLAFLINGNMAVSASSQGGLLVHVDPGDGARFLKETGARPMEMRGRKMEGWLRVDSSAVRTTRELDKWVRRGADYAMSLPKKR